jgi:hypothetical protein
MAKTKSVKRSTKRTRKSRSHSRKQRGGFGEQTAAAPGSGVGSKISGMFSGFKSGLGGLWGKLKGNNASSTMPAPAPLATTGGKRRRHKGKSRKHKGGAVAPFNGTWGGQGSA